jgi:hypothetical protein
MDGAVVPVEIFFSREAAGHGAGRTGVGLTRLDSAVFGLGLVFLVLRLAKAGMVG